jgi:hypothetical protein
LPTTYLPDEDCVVRYVAPRLVARDPDTREIMAVFPEAFRLREDEGNELSCAWLEFYPGNREDQIGAAIAKFGTVLTVRKTSAFAVGKVGEVKAACAKFSVSVRVVHAPIEPPEPPHEAHSEVRRFNDSDEELLALLAEEVWAELHGPIAA